MTVEQFIFKLSKVLLQTKDNMEGMQVIGSRMKQVATSHILISKDFFGIRGANAIPFWTWLNCVRIPQIDAEALSLDLQTAMYENSKCKKLIKSHP